MVKGTAPDEREEIYRKHICELKAAKRHGDLAAYLEALLEDPAVDLPIALQSKLSNEMGWAFLQQERLTESRRSYERSLEIEPGNVTARYNLANLDMQTNDLGEAMNRYDDLLADVPDHGPSLYNKALCHVLRDELDSALPLFESVTNILPNYLGAHFWTAECRLQQNRYAEALEGFQKVLAIDETYPEARRGAAICCLETGAYHKAIELCEALLMDSGAELTALRVKGDAHLGLGEVEEGVCCHLDMAFLELDAREFLIERAKRLAEENPKDAEYYCRRILDHFPGFEPALEPCLRRIHETPEAREETLPAA